jgi:Zn-finger nucleic acid-binding protein
MDDRDELLRLIESLKKQLAEREAQLAERDAQLAERDAQLAERDAQLAKLEARVEKLEEELRRRGKNYQPKGNSQGKNKGKGPDRRRKGQRKHPGSTRPKPKDTADAIEHDVELDHCPFCGGSLDDTGEFDDVFVEDIPEPKVDVHRYRRRHYHCRCCQKKVKGRADLDVPGGTVGDRVKLLTVYSRAFLGISLGKTTQMLDDLFGISLSRAGALGHLRWFSGVFDPVVKELLELLRQSPVVHADETGWRIDGKNVWCWLFANPQIAVFLIDHHRSRQVFEDALGASLPGVLVTDFYAAYHKIDCKKQRCLVHLLRELVKLREELPAQLVAKNIQPLITLFQDAIALGNERATLSPDEFAARANDVRQRFSERWWRQSSNPDCQRIYKRLRKHKDELLVFLDYPDVPPHNNPGERDIRSVAAARSDGGVNRVDWSAKAFGVAKSIVRTCQKSGCNFFRYGKRAIDKYRARLPLPIPTPDTS